MASGEAGELRDGEVMRTEQSHDRTCKNKPEGSLLALHDARELVEHGGIIKKKSGLGGFVICGNNARMDCAITGKRNLQTTPSLIKTHIIRTQPYAQEKLKIFFLKNLKLFEIW